MEEQAQSPPVTPTETPSQTQQPLQPHRGTVILVLGILGIVCCLICGIVAWVMGNNDLKQMAAGTMDRSGEGMTKAGKICGMIGVIWNIIVLVGLLLMFFLGISMFAVSAPRMV